MRRHIKLFFRSSKKQPSSVPPVRTVKGAIFRVTGIPRALTTDALEAAISAEFSAEQVTVDGNRTRICSSCSDQKMRTALIVFKPHAPLALDNLLSAGTYEVEIRDLQCDISIDRDFQGLTQLYPTRGPIRAE